MTPHYQMGFKMYSRLLLIAAVVSATIAYPAVSNAALLPVGGQLTPTTVPPLADEGTPAGNVLATLVSPYAGIGFSGTLTSRVLNNDASNPYGPTGLTFTYELSNAATSVH